MHFAWSPNTAAWLKELQNANNEVKQSGCTRSKSTHDICSLKDMKTAPGVRITLQCLDVWERTETKLRQNYGCNRRAGGLAQKISFYSLYKLFHVPTSNFLANLQVTNLFISSVMQNLQYNYSIILQAIKAFCLVTRVDPSQFQNDGCNTAALTKKKKQNNTYMGQERWWESGRVKVRMYSLNAVLHLPVPGNLSLGITFPKINWVFFSEWEKDGDFIIQNKPWTLKTKKLTTVQFRPSALRLS